MIEVVTTYCMIALMFGMMIDLLAQSNIGMGDKEYDEVMSCSIIRITAIFIVSAGWIITLPIMIINNTKEA